MKANLETKKQNINFYGAADRVIGTVAAFGEEFCAHLFQGQVVSNDHIYNEHADVFVDKLNLAVQVKMCNQHHASRPALAQISRLSREVGRPGFVFDIDHGVYALVFYRGVKGAENGHHGRSMLLSRKLDVPARRRIIARELQYVYVIDVKLMQHFARNKAYSHLHRIGGVIFCERRKVDYDRDPTILYLNRTFLKGFYQEGERKGIRPLHRKALDATFGDLEWRVDELQVPVRFFEADSPDIKRHVPVRIIASKETARKVRHILSQERRRPMFIEPMPT